MTASRVPSGRARRRESPKRVLSRRAGAPAFARHGERRGLAREGHVRLGPEDGEVDELVQRDCVTELRLLQAVAPDARAPHQGGGADGLLPAPLLGGEGPRARAPPTGSADAAGIRG
jgi:hypothetical protein